MNKPTRDKMPPSERAKQFMPFAAVKGLDEALERKRQELLWQDRKSLSDDMLEQLNGQLCRLKKGAQLSLISYCRGEYRLLTGNLERVNTLEKMLLLSGERIFFEDILEIRQEESEL